MTVTLAENIGFCFGVKRAVGIAEAAAAKYGGAVTLGHLIHNKAAIAELEAKGIKPVSGIDEIPEHSAVILRSHGASLEELAALKENNVTIIDATCPFVAKIHKIIEECVSDGSTPVIIGEKGHAEVRASASRSPKTEVFSGAEEFEEWLSFNNNHELPIKIVFQTTLSGEIFENTANLQKKMCTNAKIYDTICGATQIRQEETARIASSSDIMIIVGDRQSANTKRLLEIAARYCTAYLVENAGELPKITGDVKVGITAGASTPFRLILEVNQKMNDETEIKAVEALSADTSAVAAGNAEAALASAPEPTAELVTTDESETAAALPVTEERAESTDAESAVPETAEPESAPEAAETSPDAETFEQMVEKSIKTLRTGDRVTGVVAAINPNDITVDLGIKQSGYIPLSELSDDPTKPPESIVKIGDEIETFVIRVNDVEGTVQLSRRRIDAIKNWHDITRAAEDKTVVEGKVTEINKGGAVVMVRGVRVFVPASRTGVPRDADMQTLVGKTVRLIITEVSQQRRRVVGSISDVTREERRLAAAQFWAGIEVGKRYHGVITSLTRYGAFVDVGGVDGMVHVSELTWQRIRNPAEIVKVGDEIDVYIISYDPERKKISLGCKDRTQEPWTVFTSKYGIGDTAPVKVVKLMPFGAFAQIVPGVDGLIHVSQITDHHINTPGEVLKEGDEVNVKITDIDFERHKISLSIRELIEEAQPEYIESGDDSDGPAGAIVYDTDHPTNYDPEE